MSIEYLPTVKGPFSDAINYAIGIAEQLYGQFGVPVILTSGRDGKHRVDSKHYEGNAVDLRSKNLSRDRKQTILSQLRSLLGGKGFDVLLEDLGGSNEHFHIEYDSAAPFENPIPGTSPPTPTTGGSTKITPPEFKQISKQTREVFILAIALTLIAVVVLSRETNVI